VKNGKPEASGGFKQRKVRNFLLQPYLQIQLGLYTVLLTVVFYLLFMAMVYVGLGRIYELILDLTDLPQEVRQILYAHVVHLALWLCGLVVAYLFVIIGTTVYFTHKMVGPTIAFRRLIGDMQSGRFNTRIKLRKGDAFNEVAEDLNKLAETLDRKSRG